MLDIPKSQDILEYIQSLSDTLDDGNSSPRSRAHEAIKKIEREAMQRQKPQPGLNELITRLAAHNLRLALCTRNFELPVKHLLEQFVDEEARMQFSPLITRETEGVKAKPSPEGIWACVKAWESPSDQTAQVHVADKVDADGESEEAKIQACERVIMVGDSVDDIEAGARAGAATVLLVNEENKHLLDEQSWPKRVDLGISRLDELADVLERGFVGRG